MNKKKYIFTKEQEQYILENWGKESAHSMKKKFGCSWYAVVNKALELGLDTPKSSKENLWTTEQDDFIKENAQKMSVEEIAKELNRSITAIHIRGNRIGVHFMRKWTKEEERILEELWGYNSREVIAKKLNRTVDAIIVRATRLHLGPPADNNLNFLKISEIERYLNVSRDKISITWKKHGLKFYKIKVSKKKSVYGIKVDELLKFLELHQDCFDARFLEENILFSPEPEWLIEKRKRDYQTPPREYRTWTENEKKLAIKLLLLGKDYKTIGENINRSPIAVSCKLHELNYSYQLSQFWKASEIKILRENFESGFTKGYIELSQELNRSIKSVQAKCEELGYIKKRIISD